jgi:beta-galactosidase
MTPIFFKRKSLYAYSEEVTTSNSAADRVFDQQESTIWQTATSTGKLPHPHQLVIDLGANVRVRALRYLPRTDRSTAGMIKDFRLFLKTKPFTF